MTQEIGRPLDAAGKLRAAAEIVRAALARGACFAIDDLGKPVTWLSCDDADSQAAVAAMNMAASRTLGLASEHYIRAAIEAAVREDGRDVEFPRIDPNDCDRPMPAARFRVLGPLPTPVLPEGV